MKWLKLILRFLSVISLVALLVTKDLVAAVCLLVFASIQLGILIAEHAQKKENKAK